MASARLFATPELVIASAWELLDAAPPAEPWKGFTAKGCWQ
jgi:hypothetical protein